MVIFDVSLDQGCQQSIVNRVFYACSGEEIPVRLVNSVSSNLPADIQFEVLESEFPKYCDILDGDDRVIRYRHTFRDSEDLMSPDEFFKLLNRYGERQAYRAVRWYIENYNRSFRQRTKTAYNYCRANEHEWLDREDVKT